ncbi:M1 family aminopeptidase [Flavobacterium psychrotolerans]|uniref:Aminopeptidase N n=1 Tax=Flavobacterium psychrotolerans TaxID=2169410 RepID=A0A2U1JJ60_9FLAO|nr:M1 family aminopeptidase [Flavobacterium psychrotolerans]PWA05196.1 peptidase M1 [Flavobacterium psychrotolerans]
MKKNALLVVLLSLAPLYAQTPSKELDGIAHSEKQSAHNRMVLVANPDTDNYDITYHKLEFKVDPADYFIAGKVTTTYTALANLSTVIFDLANELMVSAVKKNGMDLAFTQNGNNELVISLPATQGTGTEATLEITYSGAPPTNGFNAFTSSTHNGSPVIYTLSEPFGARDWWPCKQDLNDKINSIDVYITAPSQYVSVSNGLETTAPVIEGTLKTTHFHHGYPIPAYLIAIAVTNYSVYTQEAGTAPTQYPIINYIYPESLATVQPQLDQTPLLLDFYESIFTPYPFRDEKYGHAQFGWGGGMEHTTVSFMVGFERGLIAHEMAHQWFGDKVTCGSWKDIWLNEGFATYLASMVIEHFDGEDAFISDKNNMISSITGFSDGAVYLTDAEATDVDRIFSSRYSYKKGAMVLNMLRFKLGDTAFFQGIKNYLNDPLLTYGYAKTPDLQMHLETASGMGLTEFFSDWVYNQGYPSYVISANNSVPNQVQITIKQTQSHSSVSFFEMPVPIRLVGSGGEQKDIVLENTINGQTFLVDVPFIVTDVIFDPQKDIISKNNSVNLGVGYFDLKTDITLYPNPAMNHLTLSLPQGVTTKKTVIFNNLGQKTIESTFETSWDISALATGVYYVKTITNLGMKQLSFIKN